MVGTNPRQLLAEMFVYLFPSAESAHQLSSTSPTSCGYSVFGVDAAAERSTHAHDELTQQYYAVSWFSVELPCYLASSAVRSTLHTDAETTWVTEKKSTRTDVFCQVEYAGHCAVQITARC